MKVGSVVYCKVSHFSDVPKNAIGLILEIVREGSVVRVYFPQTTIEWCPMRFLELVE